MDERKEKFLARLRETFRVEAVDHVQAITAGLVALERASDAERDAIVERVFREAHSLKGAARSVSRADVEAPCNELESIFAAVQHKELALSTETLDAIHRTLEVVAALCADPGATTSAETKESAKQALSALARIAGGSPAAAPEGSTPAAAAPEIADATASTGRSEPRIVAAPAASDTVRVSTQKLGAILREAEELVGAKIAAAARAAELRVLAGSVASWNQQRLRDRARFRQSSGGAALANEILESEMLYTKSLETSLRKLSGAVHQDSLSLAASTDRILEDTKKVLMLPCSYLLDTLPSVARALAREQGKEALVLLRGEDIEIDRRVLDEIKDPLVHLLRNAIDHGVELPDARRAAGKPSCGSVTVAVRPVEGNRVELTLTDDGAGIDAARVAKAAVRLGLLAAEEAERPALADVTALLFSSGLSTSPIITDLSGRGLGLAIVREKVEKLGGTITVTSTPGAGTAFQMLLPLSLATFRGVVVEAAGRHFAIPTSGVVRVGRVKPDEIKTIENRRAIKLGDRVVSLVALRQVLELSGPDPREPGGTRPLVVVRAGERQIAFLVDEVHGEREVMVRTLGPQLKRVRHVAGASISGTGGIIPILDVLDLVDSAGSADAPELDASARDVAPERRARLLIAEDSITARTLVKNILEGAGYEVIATVDGLEALTRLKTEPFDLVVSDVDMPRMNGFELTTRIRGDAKLAALPVVLVTALGSQKDREYGIQVGANAYLVKSDFDQSNLLEIIGRLL